MMLIKKQFTANYPDMPYGVTVPVVSNADCNVAYGGDIYDDMMCLGLLGTGGKDSCQVSGVDLFVLLH